MFTKSFDLLGSKYSEEASGLSTRGERRAGGSWSAPRKINDKFLIKSEENKNKNNKKEAFQMIATLSISTPAS